MRRLARHLFTFAAALSLLLLLATCVLWVRSYRGGDQVLWTRHEPDAAWVTSHRSYVTTAPLLRAIEKVGVASSAGRVRLRRAGWIAEDDRMPIPGSEIDGFGGAQPQFVGPPLTTAPPAGVTAEPGLEWSRGDAVRLRLMIERRRGEMLGFGHECGFHFYGNRGWFDAGWSAYESAVELPHWFLAAGFGLPPALAIRRMARRRRRTAAGLCLACGYDLRASPQRCPECGSAATLPARSATATCDAKRGRRRRRRRRLRRFGVLMGGARC